jgi:1-acyl-sn-glycerol-3-phosphate acyltransferase
MGESPARLLAVSFMTLKSQRIPARMSCSRPAGTGILAGKILRNLRGLAVFSAITVNTVIWFLPILLFAVVKLLLPVGAVRRLLTRWIMAMGECWVSGNTVILGFRRLDRADVRGIEGLSRENWYLVIANHQTWVDIIVLQIVLNRRVPFLKFFIKQQLIWFPLLGIAWWAMDMPFMKRHSKSYLAKHPEMKGRDFEATRIACRKFQNTPTSVINFIEGTRFSAEKKIRRNSSFEHLLPPRAGGVALALTSMGGMFDCILDVTFVYPNGVAQFWDLCCGQFDGVIIDIRRRPVEAWMVEGDYEHDREFRSRFHRWLTQIWQDKDARIESLLREGTLS